MTVLITVCRPMLLGAQSHVDSGISVHNYKHLNKAEKAKKEKTERAKKIEVSERYRTYQQRENKNSTPKYAVQAPNLVIEKKYKKEKITINPLTNPANYKAPNGFK